MLFSKKSYCALTSMARDDLRHSWWSLICLLMKQVSQQPYVCFFVGSITVSFLLCFVSSTSLRLTSPDLTNQAQQLLQNLPNDFGTSLTRYGSLAHCQVISCARTPAYKMYIPISMPRYSTESVSAVHPGMNTDRSHALGSTIPHALNKTFKNTMSS